MNFLQRKFPMRISTNKLLVKVLLKSGELVDAVVKDGVRISHNQVECTDCSFIFNSIMNKSPYFQQSFFTSDKKLIPLSAIQKVINKEIVSEQRVLNLQKSLFGKLSWR